MQTRAEEIRSFILNNIPEHPKNIVAVTAAHFSVSRTTVHRHLTRLLKDKKILKTGTTVRAVYTLFSSRNKNLEIKIQKDTDEDKIWKENLEGDFSSLTENVLYICNYGFTEIYNNAIEHSEGEQILVTTKWNNDSVKISISDDGVGIFKKIKRTLNLEDERESILHLSKGKFTTDPERHTGEGIFFTSRCFDKFWIMANGLIYHKCNDLDDWFFETRDDKQENGTCVVMEIRTDSKRSVEKLFAEYSNMDPVDGIKRFDKTHILVSLSKFGEEHYISRSQAKRILVGLDKFREVILDFRNIRTIGQGFVDEVFRVFQRKHRGLQIKYINANDNIQFMIERGLPLPEGE